MFDLKHTRNLVKQQFRALSTEGTLAANVAYVFSGKMLATIAGFLLMPVLSRILDQEAFGIFGILNHFMIMCAVVIGLRLSDAYILKVSDLEFLKIKRVVHSCIILLGALLMLLMILFGDLLFEWLELDVGKWVQYVLAPLVVLYAFKESQGNETRRWKEFKFTSAINSSMDLLGRLVAIALGLWVTATFIALLAKELVRISLNMFLLSRHLNKKAPARERFRFASKEEFKSVISQYARFPKFEMPSALAGMLYASLPLYLLGPSFGMATVGDFTIVRTLLIFPTLLLTNSLVSVVQRSAADHVDSQPEKLRSMISISMIGMTAVASLGIGLVLWYGEEIFGIFLGEKWSTAGIMASIMAPLFMLRMVSPILEGLRVVLGTQEYNLLFRGSGVLLTLIVIVSGIKLDLDLHTILFNFTLANCLLLLVSMLFVLVKIKIDLLKLFASVSLTAALGIGLAYLAGIPFF